MAMDSLFSDTPAADDGIPGHGGCTVMEIMTGIKSTFTQGYPMASTKQIPEKLQEFICHVGAPLAVYTDGAKEHISKRFSDILRMYNIGTWFSKAKQQNQNPTE